MDEEVLICSDIAECEVDVTLCATLLDSRYIFSGKHNPALFATRGFTLAYKGITPGQWHTHLFNLTGPLEVIPESQAWVPSSYLQYRDYLTHYLVKEALKQVCLYLDNKTEETITHVLTDQYGVELKLTIGRTNGGYTT